MARGNNDLHPGSGLPDSSYLARAVLGAGVTVTQPGDWVIVPKEAMGELAFWRMAYRLAFALCFGAGVGLVILIGWPMLQLIFGNACQAFAAFTF